MGIEIANYINQLVATNPLASDPKAEGDDHLRLLKTVLLATFPNVGGAVTLTHTQINDLLGTIVTLTGDQTVAGVKTFSSSPVLPGNASANLQAVPLQQLIEYVDSTCFDVGDYKFSARASMLPGRRWLLCDSSTIGNASSGATALASAEAQELFEYMWSTYSNGLCPIYTSAGAVSTRGASAAADWSANKRLALLDWRGLFPRVHHSGSDNNEVDVSRALGSLQGDEIRSHTHGGKCLPSSSNTSSSGSGTAEEGAGAPNMALQDISAFGGAETRPKNRSLNMFIRY